MKKKGTSPAPKAKNSAGMAVVDYERNGKTYRRVKHSQINKATDNMKANRAQFASRQAVLTKFADAYRIGFDQLRIPGQSGYNAGISFNTAHAVTDGVVDLNRLQLSQGALPGVDITACRIEQGELHIDWKSQVACNAANRNDHIYLCVAMESMGQRPLSFCPTTLTRETGHFQHLLPKDWDKDTLFVYAFAFRKEAGICSTTTLFRLEK